MAIVMKSLPSHFTSLLSQNQTTLCLSHSPLPLPFRLPSNHLALSHQFRKSNNKSPRRRLIITAARIESKPTSLGSRPPDFELPEPLTGKTWTLDDFESYPALLVMFICNHCPFVIHLKKDIVKLTNFYTKKGLGVIAISSNSVVTHPQDGPEFMAEDAKSNGYSFPYLYDESQDVARAFGAVCTPEFFLYKKDGRRPFELVYHGQFDDSRPSNNMRVTGRDLSMAIDCVLSAQPVNTVQKPRIQQQRLARRVVPMAGIGKTRNQDYRGIGI